jgi:hypothetical protein
MPIAHDILQSNQAVCEMQNMMLNMMQIIVQDIMHNNMQNIDILMKR